jgi:NADH dehydrogenase [ubiquinone] 1 alpha subcomplex assembly factor 5
LHWVNDLPGTLIQIQRALKPGGLFLASLPGGETLKELRQSFEQAEISVSGGVSPRISPFIDVKDAGSLLQRAGFSEPVTDSEILTISYENPMKLLRDLRGMGESNALLSASKAFSKRSWFSAAMDYYRQQFSTLNGLLPATFEIVTLTAWKPNGSK